MIVSDASESWRQRSHYLWELIWLVVDRGGKELVNKVSEPLMLYSV